MALNVIQQDGSTSVLNVVGWSYSSGNLLVSLRLPDSEEFQLNYPLPIVQETETFSDYQTFLFKNRHGSREDQYFPLEINGQRRAVVFPIKIFKDPSNLPSPADDPFAYRFLYIAFQHLVTGVSGENKQVNVDVLRQSAPLNIEDFYDEETVVFIYFDHTGVSPTIDIEKLYPSLFLNGYVPLLRTEDYNEIERLSVPIAQTPLYNKTFGETLKLDGAGSLMAEPFINQMMGSILKRNQPALIRFVLLYQVIEYLINKLAVEHYFSNEPDQTIIAALLGSNAPPISFKEIGENMKVINGMLDKSIAGSEKDRINQLLATKCKLELSHLPSIVPVTVALIPGFSGTTIRDYLYQVRNKIVHSYHTLMAMHPNLEELIEDFNVVFEQLIANVAIKYP